MAAVSVAAAVPEVAPVIEQAATAVVESTPKRARREIDTPMKRLFEQALAKAPVTPPHEVAVNRVMQFDD